MEFARRDYWSELPFPSPGDPPIPGIKPTSTSLAGRFLTTAPPGKVATDRQFTNHAIKGGMPGTRRYACKRSQSKKEDIWFYFLKKTLNNISRE